MRSRRLGAASLLLALLGAALPSPSLADAAAAEACRAARESGVPEPRLQALARGFNLTSWIDVEEPRRPDPETLRTLFRAGFTHVRLPVTLERISEHFRPKPAVAARRRELDRALDLLLGIGFAVSVDLHPGAEFNQRHKADPERGLALVEALWTDLAGHLRARPPERLFLEVLNEPEIEPRLWNVQAERLVAAIRRVAPAHTIVLGPAYFQRLEALEAFRPMADRNVVYAVHYYEPMAFTHQGMTWASEAEPLKHLAGVPFPLSMADPPVQDLYAGLLARGRGEAARELMKQAGAAPSERTIAAHFERLAAWVARHRRPVVVNEFGVLGFVAPPADRVRWIAAVRGAAERACIGWTHWEYADGFGFVKRGPEGRERPDPALSQALIGQSP